MAKRKTKRATSEATLFGSAPVLFGPDFLRDHAGQIMSDAKIALVELVANAYDAGATRVEIDWPEERGGMFSIVDNGTGMTLAQFEERWRTLGYRRVQSQGALAEFPPGTKTHGKRQAFGQSGKGRHGAFCFADEYQIETWQGGQSITVGVSVTGGGAEPFHFKKPKKKDKGGHGTRIATTVTRNLASLEDVVNAIGSKFLVDPQFAISVNNKPLQLLSLPTVDSHECPVGEYGTVRIIHIDAQTSDRTTNLRGITWWVNGRMVGIPSWNGLNERGSVLDGRSAEAKRYSFVVVADMLKPDVKEDWSAFRASDRSTATQRAVREYIIESLNRVLSQSRKERKKAALVESRQVLGLLSEPSRQSVGRFADELLAQCPTLSQGDLAKTLTLFANIEQSRSGYELLAELAACSPDDLDLWAGILQKWTATEAETVLNELHWRLELLSKLQSLIEQSKADELHELQPLFERGLWIFGPEYESVEFRSNRSLVTAVGELLGGTSYALPRKRPDFVALAERSIGLYSADAFDANSEVSGIAKVLVVELKHGGAMLTDEEVHQAEVYVTHLRKGNLVQQTTQFVVFVLGSSLADDAVDERTKGIHTRVIPMRYDTVLKRAHARTFNLLKKVRSAFPSKTPDAEVAAVLAEVEQPLFDEVGAAT
jgi:hypothetical protein